MDGTCKHRSGVFIKMGRYLEHMYYCYVSFPTRINWVLACFMDRPVHTRTSTHNIYRYTRIHHDRAYIAVVHTRVEGSVAVRPRKP